MKIFDIARGMLSFRDLCASRPVCQSWSDLHALPPYPFAIYFLEDGSECDFPDSDDLNFRNCLLAAKITIFHCHIFNKDQLDFTLKILPRIKELSIEIYGNDDDEEIDEIAETWDPYFLSLAVNLRKLEITVEDIDEITKIDFNVLKHLNYIDSNTQITYENYDNRDMKLFGGPIDYFDETCIEISRHADFIQMMRDVAANRFALGFFMEWVRAKGKQKPYKMFATLNRMRFATLDSKEGSVTLHPISGGFDLDYYITAFSDFSNMWPDMKLKFHSDCTPEMKQLFLNMINPEREKLDLPPYTLNVH